MKKKIANSCVFVFFVECVGVSLVVVACFAFVSSCQLPLITRLTVLLEWESFVPLVPTDRWLLSN